MDNENQQQLSYGGKLVGLNFNPSQNPQVDHIKQLLAEAIDTVRNIATPADSPIKSTLINRATNDLLEAQMMAVKALTWTD